MMTMLILVWLVLVVVVCAAVDSLVAVFAFAVAVDRTVVVLVARDHIFVELVAVVEFVDSVDGFGQSVVDFVVAVVELVVAVVLFVVVTLQHVYPKQYVYHYHRGLYAST